MGHEVISTGTWWQWLFSTSVAQHNAYPDCCQAIAAHIKANWVARIPMWNVLISFITVPIGNPGQEPKSPLCRRLRFRLSNIIPSPHFLSRLLLCWSLGPALPCTLISPAPKSKKKIIPQNLQQACIRVHSWCMPMAHLFCSLATCSKLEMTHFRLQKSHFTDKYCLI